MSSAKIRIGIIGCGRRIGHVLHNVLTDERKGQFEITALYDPSEASIKATKEKFAPDAKVYDSPEALVRDAQTDWIFVGSWNCFHANDIIPALEAGKHIFAEKPLAISLEDCIRLRKALDKTGGKQQFFFGLVLRYTPLYQKVKELLDSGAVGEIISVEFNETLGFNHGGYIHGNWRRLRKFAGTHLLEKCCHDMDIANWLFNSIPVKAASFGGRDFFLPKNEAFGKSLGKDEDGNEAYKLWPDANRVNPFDNDGDIVDNQVAILQYANGIRATFHTNCNSALPERRMYINGSKGAIRADAVAGTVEYAPIGFNAKKELFDYRSGDGHYGGDQVMGEAIAASMLEGKTPLASLDEGLHSAVACFGIDDAMDNGTIVDLVPMWKKVGIDPANFSKR